MNLVPLPVVIPLSAAAVLAAFGRRTPRWLADGLGIGAACASACVSAILMGLARRGSPLVYWFGAWAPRGPVALGIAFAADATGAGLALLSGVLVTAALLFSLRYFDTVGALFHVLLLCFLAGLCGFGLTGDLFDLFVFFELMSTASFALCGYKSEEPGPLQGALNFAVTNTVGAFLALTGVALLYGRTGALNLAQISVALGGRHDGLVLVAFVFLAVGLLTKAAVVPFHFWLADAHAVAPTPVCIIFSGVMVEAGLYAVARLTTVVFLPSFATSLGGLRGLLVGAGALTTVTGALMCFAQRHLKRLLAFSTVSHVGIMTMGFGLLTPRGLGGAELYAIGHAFVKASLFLTAGICLHRYGSVDEVKLEGRGRHTWGVGALLLGGALGLAGCPPFGTFAATGLMEDGSATIAWLTAFGGLVTAGAVLRVAGRISFGLGPRQEDVRGVGGETDEARETRGTGHTPVWMWIVPAVLLCAAAAAGLWRPLAKGALQQGAAMMEPARYAGAVLQGSQLPPPAAPPDEARAPPAFHGALVAAGAFALALATLFRRRILPSGVRRPAGRLIQSAFVSLRSLQSGHVGDYVTWLTLGAACLGGLCSLLLR